jgi:hypothetical protein
MLPIRIEDVFEAWAQLRLFRAGAVEGVDHRGVPVDVKFYGTGIVLTDSSSPAKVIGPLEQIALDPNNPEHLRRAHEAVDRAKGRVIA